MKRYQKPQGIETEYKKLGQQWKMMKTSQNQQGQQEYGDDVTDDSQRRSVLQKSVPMGRKEHTGGCRTYGKEMVFGVFIGYYSISPWFADHMDHRLVLLVPKLKEPGEKRGLATHDQMQCLEATIRTRWSFVVLQYRIRLHKHVSYHSSIGRRRANYLALASLTLIRGRPRSSLRRWLCSIRRLNFSSDIDCRPPVRVLMMALQKGWYRWICLEKT